MKPSRSVVTPEMLAACRAGSHDGWARLVTALQPFMRKLMRRTLARAGRFDADDSLRSDILQAGAVALTGLVKGYEPRDGISFELYAARSIRREMRAELVALTNPYGDRPHAEWRTIRALADSTVPIVRQDKEDEREEYEWLAADASGPDEQVEARDLIATALDRLDDRTIEAAARYYLYGETVQEIGDSWGTSREVPNRRTRQVRACVIELAEAA